MSEKIGDTETVFTEARRDGVPLRSEQRNEIVLKCMGLVHFIANRLSRRLPSSVERDDLVSAGVIGLLDAIEKYDPDRNANFKTYAEFRVKGEMLDFLRSLDWTPRSVRARKRRVDQARRSVEQRLGRAASDQELADEMGIALSRFLQIWQEVYLGRIGSLESMQFSGKEGEIAPSYDLFADQNAKVPEETPDDERIREAVVSAIQMLPFKQRMIITLMYFEGLTMAEVAKSLDITESRVCQIHTKVMGGRLRSILERRLG